jgi:hypothetical protein
MNLNELKQFDPRRAAGILSRAALALESGGVNPAAAPIEADELNLRRKLIEDLTTSIRNSFRQSSEAEIGERVISNLDDAIAKLLKPQDETAAIERLSLNAALPSDAYEVTFDRHLIKSFLPVVPFDDRKLVQKMIRAPQLQEDFGPGLTPKEPAPISLFGEWYNFGRERDRFLLIAAASREQSKRLLVNQFWRVYSSDVNLHSVRTLADVFEKLTSKYGFEFEVSGWHGRFLRYYVIHSNKLKVGPLDPKLLPKGTSFVQFSARNLAPDIIEVSFGVGIHLDAYARDVSKHVKFENPTNR